MAPRSDVAERTRTIQGLRARHQRPDSAWARASERGTRHSEAGRGTWLVGVTPVGKVPTLCCVEHRRAEPGVSPAAVVCAPVRKLHEAAAAALLRATGKRQRRGLIHEKALSVERTRGLACAGEPTNLNGSEPFRCARAARWHLPRLWAPQPPMGKGRQNSNSSQGRDQNHRAVLCFVIVLCRDARRAPTLSSSKEIPLGPGGLELARVYASRVEASWTLIAESMPSV